MNETLTKRLAHDEKGAVMLTGLFMSFFLVGSLWFVMGIGDATIFRDRMQEAADHAAFSSAALHAKGMNFISACNLIMLVMVIVHIVLGIIHDFALAACILTLGTGCGGWVSARRAYEGYARFMKPVLTGIHIAETVAAYGYPWLGTIKGYQVGTNYGNQGRIGGVTILTTNQRSNLDDAFVRRLAFTINFPFPEQDERRSLWQKVWPAQTAIDSNIDFAALARKFRLSGGNIRNIALSATLRAVAESRPVALQDILHATRREYEKVGRILTPAELEGAAS